MDDFSSTSSTSSLSEHFGIDKSVDKVIVLSSDSSEDETVENYCRRTANICDTNWTHRRLSTIQNESNDMTHIASQRSNDTNAAKAQCNELMKGLNSLMEDVKVLGTKFQKYKSKYRDQKHENRNSNEVLSSDDSSAYVANGVNKLIDESSHSDSKTSSTDLDHESRKRKYRWIKCSHSRRRRHNSKQKRREHRRNCIRCEDERPNCETCASGRANVSLNSPSKCQNEPQWSKETYETLSISSEDDDDDDDFSSEYSEPSILNTSKYTKKSKWIQEKRRSSNTSKRIHNDEKKMFEPRLPNEIVRKLKRGDHPAVRYKKLYTNYLSAFCYFCESDRQFPTNYWVDHIRNHTREFAYECSVCKKPKFRSLLCCSRYAVRKIKSSPLKQKLVAYVCKMCNFIQISEENIQKHIRNEHRAKQTDRRYDQVVLLPAFNSVKQPILKLHDIHACK